MLIFGALLRLFVMGGQLRGAVLLLWQTLRNFCEIVHYSYFLAAFVTYLHYDK